MIFKIGDIVIGKSKRKYRITGIAYDGISYTATNIDNGIIHTIGVDAIDYESTSKLKAKLTLPQPSKDMLKSGMKVVCRSEKAFYCLIELNEIVSNKRTHVELNEYDKNLIAIDKDTNYDIMQIWDGDTIIAQRTEKSEAELKKESIEKQISECSDKIKNLHVCIENLELEIKSL